jgi:hypothetical protein
LGTPKEILNDIEDRLGEKMRRSKDWPSGGRAFTNELKRIAPSLRERGIVVDRLENRRTNRGIPYRIGPERKVLDSLVTTTNSEQKNSDSTPGSIKSHLAVSTTPQSLENRGPSVESDACDSSDSTIPSLSFNSSDLPDLNMTIKQPSPDRNPEDLVNRYEHS